MTDRRPQATIARGFALIILFAGGASIVATLVKRAFGDVAFVVAWIVLLILFYLWWWRGADRVKRWMAEGWRDKES